MRVFLLCALALFPLLTQAAPGDRFRQKYRQQAMESGAAVEAAMPFTGRRLADVAYGPDRRQRLDLFLPAKPPSGPLPLVVFIHGGGWTFGSRHHAISPKAEAFTQAGYAFASLDYRLAPDIDIPGMLQDLAAALARLRSMAAAQGLDPNRILLSGHSAGAHLAALLTTDPRALTAAAVPLSALRGVVLLDGAGYTLGDMKRPRFVEAMYEKAFGPDRSRWSLYAPVTYAPTARGLPPFLILHVATRDLSRRESEILADALRQGGTQAEISVAYRKTHGTLNQELGLPGDPPTKVVMDFARKVLR